MNPYILPDDKLLCTMRDNKCSIVDVYTGKTTHVLAIPPGSVTLARNILNHIFDFNLQIREEKTKFL